MLSQQLHYHDAHVIVGGVSDLIWLEAEDNNIKVVFYIRTAVQARSLARQLDACADCVEAAAAQEAETPAETLASA